VKICLTREIVESFGSAIEEAAPGCELVVLEADGSYTGDPDEAEVALFTPLLAVNKEQSKGLGSMLNGAALRWLQGPGAGVDHPIWKMLLDRGVRLTNASGIHAEPITQYIFAYVLHWERNVALHQERQRARHWEIIVSGDLTEKTIGIVGLGGIGLATARVAKALGMRVLATRRTPGGEPNVDRVLPPAQLHELLAESDYVVLCVPFSDVTRNLIGAAELAQMRSEAVLINVARGGVVDEAALVEVLRERAIRGATLDVTAEEPLPPESPLWELGNCVITPHDAGYSARGEERLTALFLDNLGRYRRGEPLRNEIESTGLTR
jgi:phosphoglycerate dehydrogenase-like enzyme